MKATGIVRRIDDLGRIVIPRGIRKTLGIHEEDADDKIALYLVKVIQNYFRESVV